MVTQVYSDNLDWNSVVKSSHIVSSLLPASWWCFIIEICSFSAANCVLFPVLWCDTLSWDMANRNKLEIKHLIYARVAQVFSRKQHFAAKAGARSYIVKDSSTIDLVKCTHNHPLFYLCNTVGFYFSGIMH